MKYLLPFIFLAFGPSVHAQSTNKDTQALGIAMEAYEYPYAVNFITLNIQGEKLRMAYMDVGKETQKQDKTIMLLHGKNFFGAYWEKTINFLVKQGYRVIVPDQIGFGKSAKPDIHYSFHLLAKNTKALLDTLGIKETVVVGHSMGGMLATRFVLMYPGNSAALILENPIGLEDYRIKVPYSTIEENFQKELKATEESIRKYQKTYYVNWKEEYERFVQVHYRWTLSGEYPRLAMIAALTSEMVYTQPVVYEFPQVKVPALLIIGQEDRTTLGRGAVSEEVLVTLGQYPELGRDTAKAIPNAKLVALKEVGHIPHLAATEKFHQELKAYLDKL